MSTTTTTDTCSARGIVKNVQVPGLKNGMDYVRLGDSDLVVSKVCSTYRSESVDYLRCFRWG